MQECKIIGMALPFIEDVNFYFVRITEFCNNFYINEFKNEALY